MVGNARDRAGVFEPDSVDGAISTTLVSRIAHVVLRLKPTRIEGSGFRLSKPGQTKTNGKGHLSI